MKATIGERGQIVIPKPLRESMGLRAGQQLELIEEAGRIVVTKVIQSDDPIQAVYGIWRLPEGWDTDRAIEEMRGPAVFPDEE